MEMAAGDTTACFTPITWLHINLLGVYDFSEEKLQDTVGIQMPKLALEAEVK
ncbi:MAG: hypothetical protein WC701_01090 [Kiritimatiellales bacterium]|jgi:hypothetical protein